jgi:hemerythrin-like metal-binding protein
MSKAVEYVKWSNDFSVGIKAIDSQHKHFIGLMNKLFEAIQIDQKDSVAKIIDELAAYADKHFTTEEAFFKQINYPLTKEHMAAHAEIRAAVAKFVEYKNEDPFKVGYKLLDLLENWLFNHIATMDVKYVVFFKQNGIK